jgi:hypothetical protein
MTTVYVVCWALVGQLWTCSPPFHDRKAAWSLFDVLPMNDGVHRAFLWNPFEKDVDRETAEYMGKIAQ